MKAIWRSKMLIILVLVLLMGIVYIIFQKANITAKDVIYEIVKKNTMVSSITTTGKITSDSIVLKAQIAGIIKSLNVTESDSFKKNDTLLHFEDEDIKKNVEQAEAALQAAQTLLTSIRQKDLPLAVEKVYQAELAYEKAKDDYQNATNLHEAGAIAKKELDIMRYNMEQAFSRFKMESISKDSFESGGVSVQNIYNQIQQARIILDIAKIKHDKTRVLAPFDGIILKKYKEAGEWANAGEPLFILSKGDELYVEADIDEKYIPQLFLNQEALVRPVAFENVIINGIIIKIAPEVDSQTGTIDVIIKMVDVPAYLKKELTAYVELVTGEIPDAIVIDKKFIGGLQNDEVWVLENDTVQIRHIKIRTDLGDKVLIDAGLKENDILLMPDQYKAGTMIYINGLKR